MRDLTDPKKRHYNTCLVLLSITLVITTFCCGAICGQIVTKTQSQHFPYTIPKYLDRVEFIEVEKEMEIPVEVIRETSSFVLNQFESEEQY